MTKIIPDPFLDETSSNDQTDTESQRSTLLFNGQHHDNKNFSAILSSIKPDESLQTTKSPSFLSNENCRHRHVHHHNVSHLAARLASE